MATIIPVSPFDYVVFGATGDLTQRKLLPALYQRYRDAQIPETSRIIGASRSHMSVEEFREHARDALKSFVPPAEIDDARLAGFLDHLFYVAIDALGDEGWDDLKTLLDERPDRIRPYYLATSPDLYGAICRNLDRYGLIGENSRVVLEKPIGKDLKSARAINDAVGAVFPESQIFRIDHYLGKETVQNLLALRFANTIFERLWNADVIDHVQITVGETVGVEGRGGYYDTSGALRDMVQNHILQLLCLTAMESPISLDANSVRDEKLKVLRSLRRLKLADIARDTVRGQYVHGVSGNQEVGGYLEEKNVPADSKTETFVALRAHIDTWRWSKVPFYLRTGKRMARRSSKIVVEFANPPFPLFPDMPGGVANRLVIELQPEEAIKLQIMAKQPGSGMQMQQVALNLDLQSAFQQRRAEAYERLLIDVVRGRLTHFMRRDELEAAWAWADPIIEGWSTLDEKPHPYAAGSWGPAEAFALLARDGFAWVE